MAPASDNQEQFEYWNGPGAERWVSYQAALDRALSAFGHAAIQRLAPRPGERILDIGCGSGATLLELAAAVESGGEVVGVDLSRPLLALARERAASAGRKVTLLEADAAHHAFAPSFDALFSRFGVMFFADPVRAFQNLRRALVAPGRVAFVCWQALSDNSWSAVPLAAAYQAIGKLPPPPDPFAPGPLAFADPERVRSILTDAGFSEVELTSFRAPVLMSDVGIDAAVDFALRVGPVSRLYADLADSQREAVRREVRASLAPLLKGDTIELAGAAWIVSARG